MNALDLKNKIRAAFDRASSSYDEYSALQKKVCGKLINTIQEHKQTLAQVVDLGCGTGSSIFALKDRIGAEKIIGVDFSEASLAIAQGKIKDFKGNSNLEFRRADFEEQLLPENSLDLAFSNMSLQWSPELEKTLQGIYRMLNQNGLLAFSLPLENNFPEIRSGHKNTFLEQANIKELLQKTGFKILHFDSEYYSEQFKSSIEILRSLKRTGATVLLEANPNKKLNVKKYRESIFTNPNNQALTYHIGFFVAQKII